LLQEILQDRCVAIAGGKVEGRSIVIVAKTDVDAVGCQEPDVLDRSLGRVCAHLDNIIETLFGEGGPVIAKKLLDSWSIPDLKVVPDGVHERCAIEAIPAHDVSLDTDQVLEDLHLALACREMLQTTTFEAICQQAAPVPWILNNLKLSYNIPKEQKDCQDRYSP
jgi:hypothetical protein